MGDLPPIDLAELQRRLDGIAVTCELHAYHHLLVALSPTEAALNPLPNVRTLPPPQHRVACVRQALKAIPGVTLRGYPE